MNICGTASQKAASLRTRSPATGIPVRERFLSHAEKAEARARLGLPVEGQLLLVMTGSMGYGNVEALLAALRARIPAAHVLVMGGNNERLKRTLRTEFATDTQISVLDYTNEVSLYLDAADLLFTKPGRPFFHRSGRERDPDGAYSPHPGLGKRQRCVF